MFNEASSLYQANNFVAAKAIYEKLTKKLPANLDVINNLALTNVNIGDYTTAKKLLEKSLLINKEQPQVIDNLINILLDLKDYPYANKLCDESIKITPNNSITLFNKARALSGLEKIEEAIEAYKVVLKIDPSYFLAHQNLGYILNKLGNYEEAIDFYNKSIELNPKNLLAFYNKGIAQGNLFLFEEAIRSYKTALEIDISFLPASLNMGKALEKIGKYKYALNIYDQAQAVNPTNFEIYLNRGGLYTNLNNYDEAIFDFKKIKEINSNKKDGDYNIALLNLKFRNFEDVWDFYDLRWKIKQTYFNTKKPELKKLPSTFKKLFIWREQGIGDQIFFSNLIHNFAPFFESIIIAIDPRMVPIYQRSFRHYENFKVMSSQDTLNENDYDVQIPSGSIGRFFIKNKIDICSSVKPFLKSDSNKIKIIKRNLKKENKIICGLSWKTKNQETGFNRSINLDTLMPILQLNNFIFVNLQYGDSNKELKKLAKNYNIKNYNLIDNFNDLDGFVSLIDACDVVISIDNSCIHFAGALNKKAYLLLPYAIGTHWYWGTNQIKSEWYPSVKIIRQENPNDWESVILKLKTEIS
tara:strand:- start:91 stop:1839 length:1749 start_codon:yes stop_codon:yes gene_type:complete